MKKTSLVRIVICLLIFSLALTGCSGKKGREYDLEGLSEELMDSDAFSDIFSQVGIDVAAATYGFSTKDVEDYVVYCSTGATTEEIGLFKCVDAEAAGRVLEKAKERAESQKNAYKSYAPEEVPKVDDSYIASNGVYVFYIVSDNAETVRNIMK